LFEEKKEKKKSFQFERKNILKKVRKQNQKGKSF